MMTKNNLYFIVFQLFEDFTLFALSSTLLVHDLCDDHPFDCYKTVDYNKTSVLKELLLCGHCLSVYMSIEMKFNSSQWTSTTASKRMRKEKLF